MMRGQPPLAELYRSTRRCQSVFCAMTEVTKARKDGSGTNEGIQQYYVNKIEELQVCQKLVVKLYSGQYLEIFGCTTIGA